MQDSVRQCAVIIVDIAGSVALRKRIGEEAAEKRIRHLLDAIIAAARENGGAFVKSYGDDMMSVFENNAVGAAAQTAITAQRLAQGADLELYAGVHAGPVEFRETMGHPDAVGLTVNLTARLHKLTEGAPGRIFMAEEWVSALPPDLRSRASLFGPRELKGVGVLNIWTLDWQDTISVFETRIVPAATRPQAWLPLVLSHGARAVHLTERKTYVVGRGPHCDLQVPDPVPRVSTAHLQIEYGAGCWFVQDVSRNGTWLRDRTTGEIRQLPPSNRAMLPKSGELCLGRTFTDDAERLFTVSFQPLQK